MADHDGRLIATSIDVPERFGGIFDRHYAAIDSYCVRRLGPDGHDVSATTFTEAFRLRARFESERPDARPWLYGAATNLMRRHRRSEQRRWRALARSGTPHAVPAVDVDDGIDAGALGVRLAGALAAIPAADRDALLLFAWADLSYQEIADGVGVPIGTVRSRIARARSRLRDALGPFDDEVTNHAADAPRGGTER